MSIKYLTIFYNLVYILFIFHNTTNMYHFYNNNNKVIVLSISALFRFKHVYTMHHCSYNNKKNFEIFDKDQINLKQ